MISKNFLLVPHAVEEAADGRMTMRLPVVFVVALIIALLSLPLTATARTFDSALPNESYIARSFPLQENGTNHYYFATFDGEGEADVTAKLSFHNAGSSAMRTLIVEIPGETKLLWAVQETNDSTADSPMLTLPNGEVVLRAAEPHDYLPIYSRLIPQATTLSEPSRYVRVPPLYNNPLLQWTTYEFSLAQPIEAQKTGVLLLHYKTLNYTVLESGIAYFNFETVKANQTIHRLRISLHVQPGLHTRDMAYDTPANSRIREAVAAIDTFADIRAESPLLATVSRDITSRISHTNSGYDLSPGASFSVHGSYSKSWLRLHRYDVIFTLVLLLNAIIAIACVVAVFAARRKLAMLMTIGTGLTIGFIQAFMEPIAGMLLDMIFPAYVGGESPGEIGIYVLLGLLFLHLALLIIPPGIIARRYGMKHGLLCAALMLVSIANGVYIFKVLL